MGKPTISTCSPTRFFENSQNPFGNMCKPGFRASTGVFYGFQKPSKSIGNMCVFVFRAHPSTRRAHTCLHPTPPWQPSSYKSAQMTPSKLQMTPGGALAGRKDVQNGQKLTAIERELVSNHLEGSSSQPTNPSGVKALRYAGRGGR